MKTRSLAGVVSCLLLLAHLGCGSDEEDGATSTGGSSSSGSSGSGAASSSGAGGSPSGSGGESIGGGSTSSGGSGGGASGMSFFVTSDTAPDGNLGGLEGADMRCQMLAEAIGEGSKTWRAYLSTEDPPTDARDRIGEGPYVNALGAMVAADKDALHARMGDADVFVTETGEKVNGQWEGSPDPNQHDIMTGSTAEGTVEAGATCGDWTSDTGDARMGHSDGLGPGGSSEPQYTSWNSSHDGQCAPGDMDGAGKIYCFAGP